MEGKNEVENTMNNDFVPQEPISETHLSRLKSKKYILIGVGALFLFSIFGAGVFFAFSDRKEKEVSQEQSQAQQSNPVTPSSNQNPVIQDKYDIDSDGDSIPDFVESATGYNPNQDECLLAACEGYDANAQPKTKTNVVFILDSSGSMAGVSGASRKIDAAKNALKRYIAQAKLDTTAGLIVYGHKGSNDEKDKALSCQEIEVLYPLGVMDKEKFTAAVDSFQPVGWTPIGNALRLAGKTFGVLQKEDKNIILLVSDGVETCNTDPLGAARELQDMGLKIQIDVIGFDLEPVAKEQLMKVAEIGGGKYYNAQTSEEFDKVIGVWLDDAQGSSAALGCKMANINEFVGCNAQRSVAASSYLVYLTLSIRGDYKEVYGVVASPTQDTIDKINKTKKTISAYDSKVRDIFKDRYDMASDEWRVNYEKLKSGW
ncbi:hypothetical protein COT96_01380 [Candidatus Falkowbacteria bacterium CG10_big_fil_rev_8_21_14_0_10_38_22]|uniref:VWFA domain-containing protein n=2 Tax=Parcubacteria group TaxID=1794811 RepID=A0A2M6WRH7_9BACT|nr:MAG: hypothetical protein COT96_01380 [Candidatus Falkowbacteria bacterium CG10_big_fil_rev_8_21_14_0_10_38_22]